jgi:hypothetical protein
LKILTKLGFWLFFIVFQLVSLLLMIPGALICLSPSLAKWTWLWWNDDDGAVGATYWARYRWLAWRNPVANLRRVRFVSGPGRPLIYHWWVSNPETADIKSGHYVKIGWLSGQPYYPVLSAGAGRGY